ncbi:unnamed protein product [Peniophora sp. CBMAI 1063]|nr:unnamed protein product [Peniophora sp. CBMAI 1063]
MTEVNPAAAISIRPVSADDTIHIRHTILWPNVPKDSNIIRLAEDDNGLHFGAFLSDADSEPIAVISLFHEDLPLDSGEGASHKGKTWRVRKFACLSEHQGKGVGSKLLAFAIQHARDNLGAECIWCDARLTAAGWYTRRGLTTFGDLFLKNGAEYVRMKIVVQHTTLAAEIDLYNEI